ncbi:MAG: hypothetical protein IJX94_01555 [Clostridia bacterium]|nr:hypothetical protein [Clostridia bacterium]
MRKHRFKGFHRDENGQDQIFLNGEWIFGRWVEGYYTCFNGTEHRIYSGYAEIDCGDYYPDYWTVIPETVCECTGIFDRNGKEIFEGDILKASFKIAGHENGCYAKGVVIYEGDGFKVRVTVSHNAKKHAEYTDKEQTAYYIVHNFVERNYSIEVVGTTYDNPELLKCETKRKKAQNKA